MSVHAGVGFSIAVNMDVSVPVEGRFSIAVYMGMSIYGYECPCKGWG